MGKKAVKKIQWGSEIPVQKKIVITLLLSVFFLTSCGYKLMSRSEYPYQSINLSNITNMTFEPGLDQSFYEAFLSVCTEHGINCIGGDVKVNIKLTKYRLTTRSIKSNYSSEYSVVIKADVNIIYPDGSVQSVRGLSSEFDESFIAQNTVEEINANQAIVAFRALKVLSKRILNLIIYSKHGN